MITQKEQSVKIKIKWKILEKKMLKLQFHPSAFLKVVGNVYIIVSKSFHHKLYIYSFSVGKQKQKKKGEKQTTGAFTLR